MSSDVNAGLAPTEIEVTREMREAGLYAFSLGSGSVYGSTSEGELVAMVYRAMDAARPAPTQSEPHR